MLLVYEDVYGRTLHGVTDDPHGLVAELVMAGFVMMKHAATARVYDERRSPHPLTIDAAAVKWWVDWFKVLERFRTATREEIEHEVRASKKLRAIENVVERILTERRRRWPLDEGNHVEAS